MERFFLSTPEGERSYLLFAPARASGPVPLVIFLHGTGGSAEWADEDTGWSVFAAKEGFALALPEGLPPDLTKPPKFLTNPLRWNDGSKGPTGISSPADDVAFLAAVLEDAARRTAIDTRRVFVTGFSNGAGMTFRVGAQLAPRIVAIAPVAGYCWVPNPKPERPVPTFYVIGTVDPLVPWRGGEVRSPWLHRIIRRPTVSDSLERWAAANGCDVIPKLVAETGGVRVDEYPGRTTFRTAVIDGLGHHWPGGRGRLSEKIGGPPSAAFDATAEIWRFFQNV